MDPAKQSTPEHETSLGKNPSDHLPAIVDRWYGRWVQEGPVMAGRDDAAIRDLLPVQLF